MSNPATPDDGGEKAQHAEVQDTGSFGPWYKLPPQAECCVLLCTMGCGGLQPVRILLPHQIYVEDVDALWERIGREYYGEVVAIPLNTHRQVVIRETDAARRTREYYQALRAAEESPAALTPSPPAPPAGLDYLLDGYRAMIYDGTRFQELKARQAVVDFVAALSRPDRDGPWDQDSLEATMGARHGYYAGARQMTFDLGTTTFDTKATMEAAIARYPWPPKPPAPGGTDG